MDNTSITPTIGYAGFWKRFLAFVLDALILGAATSAFGLNGYQGYAMHGGYYGHHFSSHGGAISLALGWLYYSLLESSKLQATIGKMALGIKVTDLQGMRIDFGRATGRYFAKIISAIILCIGFIMIAFTQKKQGLHDIMAKTLVVRK